MWKGSRHNYSNIEFSRHFHPPLRNTVNCEVLADYVYDDNKIRFFMANWKRVFGKKESKDIRDDVMRVLDHESIHGVIMHIMYKERFTGEVNLEWPMYHGFDKAYTKEFKKEHKHKDGKRLFG